MPAKNLVFLLSKVIPSFQLKKRLVRARKFHGHYETDRGECDNLSVKVRGENAKRLIILTDTLPHTSYIHTHLSRTSNHQDKHIKTKLNNMAVILRVFILFSSVTRALIFVFGK